MSDDATLDMNDPHEAHAVFAMEFRCEACGNELLANSEQNRFSNAWFRDLASLARTKKWFAPSPDADGKMDVMRAWCPDCAARLGLALEGKVLATHPDQRPPSDYSRL
jgi:hypothetical protein